MVSCLDREKGRMVLMTNFRWRQIRYTFAEIVMLILFIVAWMNNRISDMIVASFIGILVQIKASEKEN